MRERLEPYLKLSDRLNGAKAGMSWAEYEAQGKLKDEALRQEPTVLEILRTLDPELARNFVGIGWSNANARGRILRALGILQDQAEWAVRLAPTAPTLSADSLHPTIWSAAATVWDTGEYKIAAQQAAVSLSVHIKAKSKSHLNERDLVSQVFKSEEPTATQSRLHFPGDRADRNWQSRQQGLHLIAQGAFAGIRNIAVHDDSKWAEHQALEHLAVLSVVARWPTRRNCGRSRGDHRES